MARNVAQRITRATAIRAPLDDRIGFNRDDFMVAESMLPEEHERMLEYEFSFPTQWKQKLVEEWKKGPPGNLPPGGLEIKTAVWLEDDLSSQLKHSSATKLAGKFLYIDNRSGVTSADCGAGQGRRVKTRIAIAVRSVRVGGTGMVEHVGCFRAELEPRSLPYLEILENREVDVRKTRSVKRVSRRVAEGIVPRSNCSCSGNKRVLSNRKCVSAEVDT